MNLLALLCLVPRACLGADHQHFAQMGAWEWATAVLAGLVCIWALWRTVRYALNPGETDLDHIKRSILDDVPPAPPLRPPDVG